MKSPELRPCRWCLWRVSEVAISKVRAHHNWDALLNLRGNLYGTQGTLPNFATAWKEEYMDKIGTLDRDGGI